MNSEELKKKYTEFAKNGLVQVQYSCSGNSSSFNEFELGSEEENISSSDTDNEANLENSEKQ